MGSQVIEQDEQFLPFAEKFEALAKLYDDQGIVDLIEQHLS